MKTLADLDALAQRTKPFGAAVLMPEELGDLIALAREALTLKEHRGACRNGHPHYCPNCDNQFYALPEPPR